MAGKRLLSGIKPTGDIHIGNYFGAMRQFVDLQDEYASFIFVADLHALNQVHDGPLLRRLSREIVAAYLAIGLDPEKTVLFRQSDVPEHAELCVILNSITSLGLLERAHAYKDALAKGKPANVGLFDYPVLMAADILLYQPELVPVGKDQQQHIEIMADIAGRFNHLFGDTFSIPKGLVLGETGTVIGTDGQKMSKSYNNVIGLFDEAEVLRKKVMGIKTASTGLGDPIDPETCNVYALHQLFGGDLDGLAARYRAGEISFKESKELLLDKITAFLAPIQEKHREVTSHPSLIDDVLAAGADAAQATARETMGLVRERIGLG